MQALFNGSWRKRAAIAVLVIYAVCVAAPAMAFAFGDAGTHCLTLTEAPQASNDQHVNHHADDAAPPAAPAADDQGLPGKCCGGTFCLTVLVPAYAPLAEPVTQASTVARPFIVNLFGHGADRIDRPPRNLASL